MLEQGTINIHTENIFRLSRSRSTQTTKYSCGNSYPTLMPFKSSKWYPVLENTGDIGEAEIQISIDKTKDLSITDNGIGMTAEEKIH